MPLAEWEGLHREPSVEGLLSQGYGYVYVDEKWWDNIPIESKVSLSQSCVLVISEYWSDDKTQFRRLLDISQCQP